MLLLNGVVNWAQNLREVLMEMFGNNLFDEKTRSVVSI